MVEYALLAGFIAVAAAATFPPLATDIIVIFSKVTSLADQAAAS
jgi:Flp pilus assembly pilin Flp